MSDFDIDALEAVADGATHDELLMETKTVRALIARVRELEALNSRWVE